MTDTRLRGFWRGLFQGRFDSIQIPLNEELGSKDNMQLLGLPLELFRVVLGKAVPTLYGEELIRLQLVNS